MIKVTKDGQTYYDIEDSEESMSAARQKGYRPVIEVTKDGSQSYFLDADDTESVRSAFDKGYMETNAFKNTQESLANKPKAGAGASFGLGAAKGMSMGLADEGAGALNAIYGAVTKGTLSDIAEDYTTARDDIRGAYDRAEQDQKGAFLAGNIAGGLSGGFATGAVKSLSGAASLGALGGYGEGEGDFSSQAVSTLGGAALGAAGQAAANTIGKISQEGFRNAKRASAISALDPTMRDSLLLENKGMTDRAADLIADSAGFGQSRDQLAESLGQNLAKRGQVIQEMRETADQGGARVDLMKAYEKAYEAYQNARTGPEEQIAERALNEIARQIDNANLGQVQRVPELQKTIASLQDQANYNTLGVDPVANQSIKMSRDLMAEGRDQALKDTLSPKQFDSYQSAMDDFSVLKNADAVLERTNFRKDRQGPFSFKDIVLAKGVSQTTGGQSEGIIGMMKDAVIAASINQVRSRAGSSGATVFRGLENAAKWVSKTSPNSAAGLAKMRGWSQALAQAATRSPQAVSATYYILQKTDPEFRQAIQDEENP